MTGNLPNETLSKTEQGLYHKVSGISGGSIDMILWGCYHTPVHNS